MGYNRERLMHLFKMEDRHYDMLLEYRDARKVYFLRGREGRATFILSIVLYVIASYTDNGYTLTCAFLMTAIGWAHWFATAEARDKPIQVAKSILRLRKHIGLQRMVVEKDEVHDFLPHGLVHLRKKIEDVKKEIEEIG